MGKMFGGGGGMSTQTINPMPGGTGDMPGLEGDLFREMARNYLAQLNKGSAVVDTPFYQLMPQNPNMQAMNVPQFDPQQFAQMQQAHMPQQGQFQMLGPNPFASAPQPERVKKGAM